MSETFNECCLCNGNQMPRLGATVTKCLVTMLHVANNCLSVGNNCHGVTENFKCWK